MSVVAGIQHCHTKDW